MQYFLIHNERRKRNSRMTEKLLLSVVVLTLLPLVGRAQSPSPQACDGDSFGFVGEDAHRLHLATVNVRQAYFYQDGATHKGCPGAEGCRKQAYLVRGDQVLTSFARDGWVCSYYKKDGKRKGYIGWITASSLEPATQEPLSLEHWLGTWEAKDASIGIMRDDKPGALKICGNATWTGRDPGDINTGNLETKGKPEGNNFIYREDKCDTRLTLMGRYLVVVDPGSMYCWGLNVTFGDIYLKSSSPKLKPAEFCTEDN